jgi:phosphoribosylaminoimidazolecarboxamide formyltransferase/IMP cyclohydrolase
MASTAACPLSSKALKPLSPPRPTHPTKGGGRRSFQKKKKKTKLAVFSPVPKNITMAHVITSVVGSCADLVQVKTALLSVSDKTGLIELATALSTQFGVRLLSTGGTAKAIRDVGLPVTDVSEHTGSPEILDGRVKTLHPKIHGGLLGVRGNEKHEADMAAHGISGIELVVVNLYAFDATVAKGSDFPTCIENIDIGGPSMLRSSAKNHATVAVASSPLQYGGLLESLGANNGATTLELRKALACAAFTTTAAYDASISGWFQGQLAGGAPSGGGGGGGGGGAPLATLRSYTPDTPLKYGCNPHQNPAWVGHLTPSTAPFTILNGTPGYINFLDAANAWQLVSELRAATGLPAAASFKHCSPAGAGVGVPLTEADITAYDMEPGSGASLTPLATAYLRARQADPLCSYGDFAAVSDIVDVATAEILKSEVSDGLVAPGYEPAALEILRKKKSGAFIILQATPGYTPPVMEFREVYGMVLAQKRNVANISAAESMTKKVTSGAEFSEAVSSSPHCRVLCRLATALSLLAPPSRLLPPPPPFFSPLPSLSIIIHKHPPTPPLPAGKARPCHSPHFHKVHAVQLCGVRH